LFRLFLRFLVRASLIVLTAGTLFLSFSAGAAAQDNSQPQAKSQDSAKDSGQAQRQGNQPAAQSANAQADLTVSDAADPTQPPSLGELARQMRAKKQGEAKPAKVFNDDNLPRSGGGINVVGQGETADDAPPKMVLMDFWASWCGPCRESVPQLKQLQATLGNRIEVISVNEDKDEAAGKSFVAENQMNWEQRFDSDGELGRQYGVKAFPTFVLMDADGHEVQRFVGEDPTEPLSARIRPYLKQAPAKSTRR
jgi:thiol-disulfide isomerase/thioredoxin